MTTLQRPASCYNSNQCRFKEVRNDETECFVAGAIFQLKLAPIVARPYKEDIFMAAFYAEAGKCIIGWQRHSKQRQTLLRHASHLRSFKIMSDRLQSGSPERTRVERIASSKGTKSVKYEFIQRSISQ